jgi:hypothetical protein
MAIRIDPKPLRINHVKISNRKWKRVFLEPPPESSNLAASNSKSHSVHVPRPGRAAFRGTKFYPIHLSTSFLPNSLKTQLSNFSTRNTTRSFPAVANLGASISTPRVTVFLATRHLPLTTAFLIDNMIIRIEPKSFPFNTDSISNRQYSRGTGELSISRNFGGLPTRTCHLRKRPLRLTSRALPSSDLEPLIRVVHSAIAWRSK